MKVTNNFKNPGFEKIVLISLDTLRADCIPCNPNKLYPNEYKSKTKLKDSLLNVIFSKGVFFNNVISAAPYTSASHAAYFTGRWPIHNGVYDQFNSKLKSQNIFQIFRKNRFETIFKTDFPFILGKYLNMLQGVDKYFIEDSPKALKELKSNKKQLAFFHFGQIHYPYGFHNLKYGGQDYLDKINLLEKKYKLQTNEMKLDDMAMESFRSQKDIRLLYRYKKIVAYLYKNKLDNDLFDLYLEGINYFNKNNLDRFLTQLLKIVEKKNYLLIIFSDHGEAWNEYSYGHHNSFDEGVIRVPMVFYFNGVKPKIYSNRIRTIDLAPTLNNLLPKNINKFDGKSLIKKVFDNEIEPNLDAFSAIWVNESKDVVKKVKLLIKDDILEYNKSLSVKYGAAFYKDNLKYTEYYKRFVNRSEALKNVDENQSFDIDADLKVHKTKTKIPQNIKQNFMKLNDIKLQSNSSANEIRAYLRLGGYKV